MKLTDKQRQSLQNASGLGKRVKFAYPGEGQWEGNIEDEVSVVCDRYKYVLQKLVADDQSIQYRFGYYVFSTQVKRVMWVQRALVMTASDTKELLGKAIKKGWNIT